MTPGELALYQAFDQVEPIGERRLDHLAALVCHVIDQVRAGEKARDPDAFLIRWWPSTKPEGQGDG